jgi:hypothetical protein
MTKTSSLTQSKRSGGPQSDEGKKVSSRNAIKTGAYSKAVILPGEDESEYRELEAQFIRDFAPRDIAEGAMVRELTVLTWKKIRLDHLEHRKILQTLGEPISAYAVDELFLFRPEAKWVIGYLDSLTQAYVKEHEIKKKFAQELLARQVTPQILDALKKSCRPLYDDVMQEAYEYEIENLSHGALCDETIEDEGEQKNLMHFLLGRQVDVCDDITWTYENLEKIQAGIQEIKDGRLVTLMQGDRTGRAREDLSRSFFRTLSELRKHQHWRYQRDAVDVSPPVEEGE